MQNFTHIGDAKVKCYQTLTIITGIATTILFLLVAITAQNEHYKLLPFFTLVFFSLLSLLYSRIYSVKYDSKHFYIENLFRKVKIDSSQFVRIQSIYQFEVLMMIVFKNQKYLMLAKSEDIFRGFFKPNDSIYKELTLKIKDEIAGCEK
jgi:hypothetical protein